MNTIELEPKTQKALDWVRHRSKVLSLYEMPADLAEAAVKRRRKLQAASPKLPAALAETPDG